MIQPLLIFLLFMSHGIMQMIIAHGLGDVCQLRLNGKKHLEAMVLYDRILGEISLLTAA